MNLFFELIRDVYSYSRKKFISVIIYSVLMVFTNSIGIVMLVPLLSLTEIPGGNTNALITWLTHIIDHYSRQEQVLLILSVYIALITIGTLITRKVSILNAELLQGYTKHLRISLYEGTINADWQCLMSKKRSDLINAFQLRPEESAPEY